MLFPVKPSDVYTKGVANTYISSSSLTVISQSQWLAKSELKRVISYGPLAAGSLICKAFLSPSQFDSLLSGRKLQSFIVFSVKRLQTVKCFLVRCRADNQKELSAETIELSTQTITLLDLKLCKESRITIGNCSRSTRTSVDVCKQLNIVNYNFCNCICNLTFI